MKKNTTLTKSIQDKHLEIHYNEKTIHTLNGPVSIRLQGKIFCPILNQKITSMVCAKVMDSPGWPRHVDKDVCECQANCFISKSIQKNMSKRGPDVTIKPNNGKGTDKSK